MNGDISQVNLTGGGTVQANTSLSPENTVPMELERQSKRIKEQYTQLTKILNVVTSHLTDMSKTLANYSPDVVKQIDNLNNSLESYKTKSSDIYNDIAESLALYAMNLLQNLESLTSSIQDIGLSIENL